MAKRAAAAMNVNIEPKTEIEKKVLDFIDKSKSGRSREELMKLTGASRPTVEKYIKGLGLAVVAKEKRKEFFGRPSAGIAPKHAPEQQTGDQMAKSGAYKVGRRELTAGAAAVPEAKPVETEAPLTVSERAELIQIAKTNAQVLDRLTKGL